MSLYTYVLYRHIQFQLWRNSKLEKQASTMYFYGDVFYRIKPISKFLNSVKTNNERWDSTLSRIRTDFLVPNLSELLERSNGVQVLQTYDQLFDLHRLHSQCRAISKGGVLHFSWIVFRRK